MMANQIGRFFAHEGARAPLSIAGHIRAFWDPRMRAGILSHLDAGGEGLDPAVREALEGLRAHTQVHGRTALAQAGDKTDGRR